MRRIRLAVAVSATLLSCGCGSGAVGPGAGDASQPGITAEEFDEASWTAGLEAGRASRDATFGDRSRSPLAVVAVVPLADGIVDVGSDAEADLRLDGPGVAPRHAQIVPEAGPDGNTRYRVRAVDGEVDAIEAGEGDLDADAGAGSDGVLLGPDVRAGIGRFVVYADGLGTFGAVARALDPESPPYVLFDGLDYYGPDASFRVRAAVHPFDELRPIEVIDTQGWRRPAWAYGEASFSIADRPERLVLWLFTPDPGPDDTFFVAFTDGTSGVETYPACRYLSPPFVASGPVVLDFNRATNPSCAYNDGFACPLPPPENRLSVAIRAGEKLYPHSATH